MSRIVRVVAVSLMSLILIACGATQGERRENADQLFGKVKVAYNIATVGVGAYNVFCLTSPASSVCGLAIKELANSTMARAGVAIKTAEAAFAAGNTEGAKLDYVKVAQVIVTELTDLLAKYGLTGLPQQADLRAT